MKASKPKRPRRDDHKHDEATRRILDDLSANPPDIDTLQPTQAQPVGAQSPFAVMADVRALEALQHIAIAETAPVTCSRDDHHRSRTAHLRYDPGVGRLVSRPGVCLPGLQRKIGLGKRYGDF